MLGFSAFKGIEKDLVDGVGSTGGKISLGIHNSLLQLGSNAVSYSNPIMLGAGAGAIYGGASGAFSYDGSMLGGAFHGAVLGGIGGAGLKFAANTYTEGAIKSGFAKNSSGNFVNAWDMTNPAFKTAEGKQMSPFQLSAFKAGAWSW